MKEFTLNVEDTWRRGLRIDSREQRGLHTLSECVNLKPTEFGLLPYELVPDPFLSGEFAAKSITISHPFPQIFRGDNITLLADATKIYSVDESDWSLTLLGDGTGKFVDTDAVGGSTKAITSGGPWHFVDQGDNWYLTNGTSIVFQTNINNLTPDDTSDIFINDSITIKTCVQSMGRTLIGGFDSSNFWNNDWNDMFTKWKYGRTANMDISAGNTIGTNYVMWSSIGGGDFPFWLFFPDFALRGNVRGSTKVGYDEPSDPMILDMVRKNQFGFAPMTWQGTVLNIKQLGNSVVVYGDNGITALTPILEPVPTYSIRHIMKPGILGRGAVGGDLNNHIFIDEDGYLYSMGTDLTPNRLGFREFFNGFNVTKTVVSYDEVDKEFYISDNSNSYILSGSGLGGAKEKVTSLVLKDGVLSGVITDSGVSTSQVVISLGDLGTRSIKSIENVLIDVFGSGTITVAIDYRFKKSDSFTRTSFQPVNNEGVSFVKAAGIEFNLIIKSSDYSNADFDNIKFNVKFGDKRYKRGVGASAVTT